MRTILGLAALALTAACATAAQTEAQDRQRAERETRAEEELATALAGLTAGEPTDCLPVSSVERARTNSTPIGDRTILYRVSRDLIYRNDPPGGCVGMRRGTALITQTPSARLCRGDIVQVRDLVARVDVGSCALGNFVPYRRPE